MNRRQALGIGGLAAGTAMLGGTANAQAAGTAPAALTLEAAARVIAAGVRYVQRNSLPPMYFVVVNAAGQETAAGRMDGNGPAALALVPPKARTAAAFRTATADLAAATTDPGRIASFVGAGFSLLPGGRPLVGKDGTVLGALGVGGGSPAQDDQVAQAAVRAL